MTGSIKYEQPVKPKAESITLKLSPQEFIAIVMLWNTRYDGYVTGFSVREKVSDALYRLFSQMTDMTPNQAIDIAVHEAGGKGNFSNVENTVYEVCKVLGYAS